MDSENVVEGAIFTYDYDHMLDGRPRVEICERA